MFGWVSLMMHPPTLSLIGGAQLYAAEKLTYDGEFGEWLERVKLRLAKPAIRAVFFGWLTFAI